VRHESESHEDGRYVTYIAAEAAFEVL